ncbi:hypothetical protein GQ457_08G015210 [Hibiscus cannabinus]
MSISSSSESSSDLDDEMGQFLLLKYVHDYYNAFIPKMPCRTSIPDGKAYVMEILYGNPTVCYEMFRMKKHVFLNFCDRLKVDKLLEDEKKVSVEETVAMFLFIIGQNATQRLIADRFQHSTETVSTWFQKVLIAVCKLGTKIICPRDRGDVQPEIARNSNWFPYFKDCIGAIDGTEVSAWAPASKHIPFRNRKQNLSQNVLVACSNDMLFTFVCAGWEGTAHDTRVFVNAILSNRVEQLSFPMPSTSKYYVVDAGYPNIPEFLAPFRGQRYHSHDFIGRHQPKGKEELFNMRHSSVRNVIERSIGVLKKRFAILRDMPNYPLRKQRYIPKACCTVHNFIRLEAEKDELFEEGERENEQGFDDTEATSYGSNEEHVTFDMSQTAEMTLVRDKIATSLWTSYIQN